MTTSSKPTQKTRKLGDHEIEWKLVVNWQFALKTKEGNIITLDKSAIGDLTHMHNWDIIDLLWKSFFWFVARGQKTISEITLQVSG